jgi:hypothetical protein
MTSAKQTFEFPVNGWRRDGSTSYGKDMLYRSLRHVLVRLFPETDQDLAAATFEVLKNAGVRTATIEKIRHVDGQSFYYVFGERREMLRRSSEAFPRPIVENPGRWWEPLVWMLGELIPPLRRLCRPTGR